jgi:TolB-like protein/Tfp pilus assembly protein PilF
MGDHAAISTDPLYLTALASLGSIPAKLVQAPSESSIAVLPFVNMSGDPGQEHFTDGLTEDIITDLCNVPGLFVIARNSTFAYKGKPTDVRQIAHDLGVKYTLEGSARRSDTRLRVNIQLIDAAGSGAHVFAERFDRDISDIFAVQDEITRRVVEAVSGKLAESITNERYRPSSLEAYDLCVSSRELGGQSKASNVEAQALLKKAIALDPNYCEAHWRLGIHLAFSWLIWGDPQEPNRREAIKYLRRAVELDPNDSRAHAALGFILTYERSFEESEGLFKTAIRLNPNDADSLCRYSDFNFFAGNGETAIEYAAKALRLNPKPPGWYYWCLGQAQIACGKYADAVVTLKRPETYRTYSRRDLCVALFKSGRVAEAQDEARLFIASNPEWRISTTFEGEAAFKNLEDKQFWIEAYREVGLPE